MLLSLIVSGLIVGGTVQDSLVAEQGARQVKEGSERNVMLNAEAADTITDNSLLRDYLISGTFIIPFTVNFSVSYKF